MCLDPGPSAASGPAPARLVALGQALLERNDRGAAALRERFRRACLPVVNLLSSPGAGKTALLERLGRELAGRGRRLAVIVGDLATDHDARRLAAAGVAAVPISTGQTCHLETAMVARALSQLPQPLAALDLLVIENVGNLVCPAAYDLGEQLRVVLLSVTEGEDKPLKYPAIFHSADLVVISKVDLADAVAFERQRAHEAIAAVAPRAAVLEVSARSGSGLEALATRLLAPSAELGPRQP
jgi:hydrogenase nickel incorporation protein HypB